MAKENKELLTERFQELAGIKPLESLNEKDKEKEDLKESLLNEDIFGAVAGIMGLLGTAGIVTALEMAADDPAFKEKHPKAQATLKKIFTFLQDIGGAAGRELRR
tara:strand:+ start:607 stop:921 length:315 start_codon:yes stop_codon:yes gene_type:complete